MRLLVITQTVDSVDPALGFFQSWLKELSYAFETIEVIALKTGNYHLPKNVSVFSLGKKNHSSFFDRIEYGINFFRHLIRLRGTYDVVFVHMNKEYIVLGGWYWRLIGVPVYFWYNHQFGNMWAKLAGKMSTKIFYTSPFSFFSKQSKSIQMPVGIDTDVFRPDTKKQRPVNSLLIVGRIDPVKNIDVLFGALKVIYDDGFPDFTVTVIGEATDVNSRYRSEIMTLAKPLVEKGLVSFVGSKTGLELVEAYQSHEYYVNLTNPGSFDKTILEAMSSGCLIVASNKTIADCVPAAFLFKERDVSDLVLVLKRLLSNVAVDRIDLADQYRRYVVEKHSLKLLVQRIKCVLMA